MTPKLSKHLALALVLAGITAIANTPAYAQSYCEWVIESAEYPIPMDQRRSQRQYAVDMIEHFHSLGDAAAAKGNPAEAAAAYQQIFNGYNSPEGWMVNYQRCAPSQMYRTTLSKLGKVTDLLVPTWLTRGLLFRSYDEPIPHGVAGLLLNANRYERFKTQMIQEGQQAIPRAKLKRTHQNTIGALKLRIDYLDRVTKQGDNLPPNFTNDFTKLLPEETQNPSLSDVETWFQPLYPKAAEYWLAQDTAAWQAPEPRGEDLTALAQGSFNFDERQAVAASHGALSSANLELRDHPKLLRRIHDRATQRGATLEKLAWYKEAIDYYELANHTDAIARVAGLQEAVEARQKVALATRKDEIMKNIESNEGVVTKKSAAEQQSFEDESASMADEFGFELEED